MDLKDIGLLLGLMCLHACEKSEMTVFKNNYAHSIELERGTILFNLERVNKFLVMSTPGSVQEEQEQVHIYYDYNGIISYETT